MELDQLPKGRVWIQGVVSIPSPPMFAKIIKTNFFPLARLAFAMLVVSFSPLS